MNESRLTLFAATLVMFFATLSGALGAHTLRPMLEQSDRITTWETAVLYQLVHGLAMLIVGVWLAAPDTIKRPPALFLAVRFWLAGVVLFSGSLYILSFGGPKWAGPVTPLGGLCFLTGWIILAIGIIRMKSPSAKRV